MRGTIVPVPHRSHHLHPFFRPLVAAVALATIACTHTMEPTLHVASLDTDVVLSPAQQAIFDAAGLEVRFISIIEDSRCPTDATCIWAGRAVARLSIGEISKAPTEHEVVAGESTTVHGYQVLITDVRPTRLSTQTIAQQDYRIAVRLKR